ncbi:MAG TPA: cupin domain-containing protein [Candidatus Binatia bacterium]|nr:cupin domain-containing protein [Candidatus Binatia bacterium]
MSERITPETAMNRLSALKDQRWVTMFQRGVLELEFYAPRGSDPQQPHTRDEIYFVLTGAATFVTGEQRWRVVPGEVIHMPAGQPHRFEEISDGFSTWAIFVPNPKT